MLKLLHDYCPFGMAMPGRTDNSPQYRYGFNGKEKDESGEFGNLTNYDYGFRIYNPGIGKFLSVDPLTRGYPMLTPYQFASNTPIWAIDLDGLEAIPFQLAVDLNAKNVQIISTTTLEKNNKPWILHEAKSNDGNLHYFFSGYGIDFTHRSASTGKVIKGRFETAGRNTAALPLFFTSSTPHKNNLTAMNFWYNEFVTTPGDLDAGIKNRKKVSDEFRYQLRGMNSNLAAGDVVRLGRHLENTFRHQGWMAINAFLYGEDFARKIGNAHERDGTGFAHNATDSFVDLINNEWGIKLGKELSYGSFEDKNLGDATVLADFLNTVVERIGNDIPEANQVKFSADQKSVKRLAKKIRRGKYLQTKRN